MSIIVEYKCNTIPPMYHTELPQAIQECVPHPGYYLPHAEDGAIIETEHGRYIYDGNWWEIQDYRSEGLALRKCNQREIERLVAR